MTRFGWIVLLVIAVMAGLLFGAAAIAFILIFFGFALAFRAILAIFQLREIDREYEAMRKRHGRQ